MTWRRRRRLVDTVLALILSPQNQLVVLVLLLLVNAFLAQVCQALIQHVLKLGHVLKLVWLFSLLQLLALPLQLEVELAVLCFTLEFLKRHLANLAWSNIDVSGFEVFVTAHDDALVRLR